MRKGRTMAKRGGGVAEKEKTAQKSQSSLGFTNQKALFEKKFAKRAVIVVWKGEKHFFLRPEGGGHAGEILTKGGGRGGSHVT